MSDLQDHPEYRQLVNAVRAAPDDDLPRLVLADWLEEHDAADWAEFIRVHCEAARFPHAARILADTFTDAEAVIPDWQRALTCARLVRELWPAVAYLYWGGWDERTTAHVEANGRCVVAQPPAAFRKVFVIHRGFVERVECSTAEWIGERRETQLGSLVVARQPVRVMNLVDRRFRDRPCWIALERSDTAMEPPEVIPWRIARRLRAERHDRDERPGDVRHTWHYDTEAEANAALSAAAIAWALEEAERVG